MTILISIAGLARLLRSQSVVIPYPDPGSGLLLLQSLGAVVAAIVFRFRHLIPGFSKRVRAAPPPEPGQTADKQTPSTPSP